MPSRSSSRRAGAGTARGGAVAGESLRCPASWQWLLLLALALLALHPAQGASFRSGTFEIQWKPGSILPRIGLVQEGEGSDIGNEGLAGVRTPAVARIGGVHTGGLPWGLVHCECATAHICRAAQLDIEKSNYKLHCNWMQMRQLDAVEWSRRSSSRRRCSSNSSRRCRGRGRLHPRQNQ